LWFLSFPKSSGIATIPKKMEVAPKRMNGSMFSVQRSTLLNALVSITHQNNDEQLKPKYQLATRNM
jgi:hypothetical protein